MCSLKEGVLLDFARFIKEETPTQVFFCEFCGKSFLQNALAGSFSTFTKNERVAEVRPTNKNESIEGWPISL